MKYKNVYLINVELYDIIIIIRIFSFRFLQPYLCQIVFVRLGGREERLLKIVQVQCCVCDSGNNRHFMAVETTIKTVIYKLCYTTVLMKCYVSQHNI